MHRTDAPDFSPDIGNGERGFKETPPGNETILASNFANAIQEELCYVITQAGLTLRASGSADAAAGWQQLYPAIQAIIANAIATLQASDIGNDSGVISGTVSEALDILQTLININTNNLTTHLASITAHLASSTTNDSTVTGAKVSDALNTLLAGILINQGNIGTNSAIISSHTTQINANTAGIGANASNFANRPKRRVWLTDAITLGLPNVSAGTADGVIKAVSTIPGWTDLTTSHEITIAKRGTLWNTQRAVGAWGLPIISAQSAGSGSIALQVGMPGAGPGYTPDIGHQFFVSAWDPVV